MLPLSIRGQHFVGVSAVRPEEEEAIKLWVNVCYSLRPLRIDSQHSAISLHRHKLSIKAYPTYSNKAYKSY